MYDVYIDKMWMPVSPDKVIFKTKNMNKVYTLSSGGEVNIPKLEGLKTVEMSLLIPAKKYPFAKYRLLFEPPINYIEKLEDLKKNKRIFQLVIVRGINTDLLELSLNNSFDTNLTVTLEDFTLKEDSENGEDIIVDLVFKEYKEISNKVLKIINKKNLSKNIKNSEKAKEFIKKVNPENNVLKAFIKQKRAINFDMKSGLVKVNPNVLIWQVVRKFQGNTKLLDKVMSDNKITSYADRLNSVIQIDRLVK